MIERTGVYNEVELICDVCGKKEQLDIFQYAVEFNRDLSNGWTTGKRNGRWFDLCPECEGSRL